MGSKLDRVYGGDCVRGLARLDPGSVDLAFADPPFNIGYKYDIYDDRRSAEEYLAWSRSWIEGVKRALKPNGAFWLAIGDDFAAELKVLSTRELGLHLRSWVVWFYTFGVHCKQKFTRSHTHIFYFVKDPTAFKFNSLDVRVPSARELVYGDKRADPDGRVPDDTWMTTPVLPLDVSTRDGFILRPQDIPDRFPQHSDTWCFSRIAGTFKERSGWHGCQMPEQLLGRIIRACSDEGDVVLDPFAGSGTTLAVAKKLGRRFVGFELSKEYGRRIRKRVAGIKRGDPLIGPENALLSAPKTKNGRRLSRKTPASAQGVSRSPIIAKANASLGQVAIANQEYATAIAEAFMAAHQGYSADRVLADAALNDRFLHNCRMLRIPGEATDWNRLLLNIRKRGGLSAVDTSRRTIVRHDTMEPYIFASEISLRKMSKESGYSLDEILCDPTLAEQFDKIATSIAPGFSSFQYRWAALRVRKAASLRSMLLSRMKVDFARSVISLPDSNRLPSGPGHYMISVADTQFFVGYASSLRFCPLLQPDQIGAALEAMGQDLRNERDIEIRRRNIDFAAPKQAKRDGDHVRWEKVRKKLLMKFRPIANFLSKRPAA